MYAAQRPRVPGIVVGLLVATCVVVIIAGMRFASYVVAPLFLAFMLTVVIAPLVRRFERFGLPTWLAIVGVLVLAIAVLVAYLAVVSVQMAELSQKLPEYQAMLTTRLEQFASGIESKPAGDQAIVATASRSSEALFQTVASALSTLLSGVVLVVFFLFLLCLMLASERPFERTVRRVVPAGSDFHRRFAEYVHQVQVQGHIRSASNLLTAGVLTGLFLVFRIDFAFLWGMLALALGYIPNIGLILATIPAVMMAFIQYGLGTAIVVLVLAIILNAAADNIVIPRFISRATELPMVIVFLSFIFWGWMFGLLGAIISTQATLLIRALLDGVPETRGFAQLMVAEPRKARPGARASPDARQHEEDVGTTVPADDGHRA
jgi:predicted PurR-regulated permease PerM